MTIYVPQNYRPLLRSNALVNGDFQVWQRGTSFAALASGGYFADRWQLLRSGAGVVTAAQLNSPPAVGTVGENSIYVPYAARMTVTTVDASIAAGDVYAVYQVIEGEAVRALANGFAISFWVYSAVAGVHCVSFRSSNTGLSYVAEYTVALANTWQYVQLSIPGFGISGTWNLTNGIGMYVGFAMAVGSTYQTTTGLWNTGNFLGTANQVNVMGTLNNDFMIGLVNLVPGRVPIPLVPLPYALEFQRCQRYYQVLGTANGDQIATGFAYNATNGLVMRPLAVEMGGNLSLVLSAVTDLSVRSNTNTLIACTNCVIWQNSKNTLSLQWTTAGGMAAGNATILEINAASKLCAVEWNPA